MLRRLVYDPSPVEFNRDGAERLVDLPVEPAERKAEPSIVRFPPIIRGGRDTPFFGQLAE